MKEIVFNGAAIVVAISAFAYAIIGLVGAIKKYKTTKKEYEDTRKFVFSRGECY